MLPGHVYRLPAEAEWEYACRAGTTTAFHYGPVLRSGMANFDAKFEYDSIVGQMENPTGTSLGQATAVSGYVPNAWGLYDLHGNVQEWCQDFWADGDGLPGVNVTDPQGPLKGSSRVIRGGSWSIYGRNCRSANREYDYPESLNENTGFRVVLAPAP